LVGAHETTLTDLMKQSWNVERQLEGKFPDAGYICVNVNEKQESNYKLHLELCAKDLPKMTKISECNFATTYFFEIWKGQDDQIVKVYESDLWVDDQMITHRIDLNDGELCNADHNLPLTIKFISRNQYKMENTEIASCTSTLDNIKSVVGAGLFINDSHGVRKGTLQVQKCECTPIKSFAECIKEGVQISIIGAIDFTYSNGDASNPSSLHNICPGKQN
jgi:hypothetical protein